MSKKRLLYLTLIVATLTIGVVIGTIVSGGVKAGEQKAQTLVIPDPVSLSNAFSEIAARLDPAVVNISTEAAPIEARGETATRIRDSSIHSICSTSSGIPEIYRTGMRKPGVLERVSLSIKRASF